MTKAYELKINKNTIVNVGIFTSKQEAVQAMERIISKINQGLNSDDEDYLTPFDFTLDEIKNKGINEVITTYEEAREYLGEHHVKLDDVSNLVKEVDQKHIKAPIAFNRLYSIAQAWNKADKFKPDFSNRNQDKCFPWFVYSNDAAEFVSTAYTYNAATGVSMFPYIGSRLCFKTRERVRQFGKQFIDLWNDFLLFR